MKVTFGSEYALPSYDPELRPVWRGRQISPDIILHDRVLRQEVQWELNEISFRAEFCALDGLLLAETRSLTEKDELDEHWLEIRRIFLCSPSGGEFSLFPDISTTVLEYWGEVINVDSLTSLVRVMQYWPLFPHSQIPEAIPEDQHRLRSILVILLKFYTKTFILHFSRIPALPSTPPLSLLD